MVDFRPLSGGYVKPMNAKIWTMALLCALAVTAQPVAAEGPVEELVQKLQGCPIVDVLTYPPYVAYHEECLPLTVGP